MEQWLKDFLAKSSVKLPDGGDTHIHPWKGEYGATITTRVPGGLTIHQDVQDFTDGLGVSAPRVSAPRRSSSPAFREQPVWRPPPVNPML